MPIIDYFMARHREIEERLTDHAIDFSHLSNFSNTTIELCEPTSDLLRTALKLPDHDFTSWLPGMPLAALLAAGRRILVDIAPAFLSAFRSNYGISENALIAFAKARIILFNIRDFDPTAPEDVRIRQARDYGHWTGFIERIFNETPDAVYFLAALRPRVFDAIPNFASRGEQAVRPPLVDMFGIARHDLSGAAAAAKQLSKSDSLSIRALFRTEEAEPVATFWHWAYFQSVNRFVDPDFRRYMQTEFDSLADVPPSGYVGTDEEKSFQLGTRFVEFQMRMRYAHLRYSAPLSGAFGGAYGYSLDDDHVFMQAVDRHYRWSDETPFEYDYFHDDLLDLIQDLQIGHLRPRFGDRLPARQWEMLKTLGCDAYGRTEKTSYFDHYSDERNQGELIDFWHDSHWRKSSYAELQDQMDSLLGKEGGPEPRDLFELAAMKDDARAAANSALRKHTEGYQIISSPARGSHMLPAAILATDPKEPNLLMRLLGSLGLETGNGDAAVGKGGDYGRIAYSAGGRFRNRPS